MDDINGTKGSLTASADEGSNTGLDTELLLLGLGGGIVGINSSPVELVALLVLSVRFRGLCETVTGGWLMGSV